MKTISRVLLAVVVLASVLMLSSAASSPVAAATRCTASPNHNLEDARTNFANECGRTWDASRPDTCDYKSDGFHCHGLKDEGTQAGSDSSNRPSAPVATHATRSGNEVSIRWNPVPGAVGYDVYRDGSYVGSTSAEDTDFWEQGENPLAYYNIVAVDADGNYSKWSQRITPSTGSLFLAASPAGGNQFTFGWTNHGASTHLPVTYALYSVRPPSSRYEPVRERPIATGLTNNQVTVTAVKGEKFVVYAYVSGYRPIKSQDVIPVPDFYPVRFYDEAEARIRARIYGGHLSEATKEQIVKAAASAFGDRPSHISKWHSDAGGEIHPYNAGGLVRCSTAFHDTKIYLPDTTTDFTIVHELAHVIDCSSSGRPFGNDDTDGVGTGMNSADQTTLSEERHRLFVLNNSGNRPAWLRDYSFSNRTEFFADVSSYFLTSEWHRTQMALEAPDLYDMLRSYYNKTHWSVAADIE